MELIVANGGAVCAKLLHEVKEVERKAVVVVDDDNFHRRGDYPSGKNRGHTT